jgi:biotin carboxylase
MKEGLLQRILVLPGGAEARRIHDEAARVGIETVFCFTDRDAEALWPDAGDYAVHLARGEDEPFSRVVELAVDAGVDGVWAGSGRMGRSAELIEALGMAGITSMGPYPSSLLTLADPLELRRVAHSLGVPVVPASAPCRDLGEALAWIAMAGLPALLRPALGRPGLPLFSSEGLARELAPLLGDGPVIVERVVEQARTLDLPFVGDGQGGVVRYAPVEVTARHEGRPMLWERPPAAISEGRRDELDRATEALARHLRWRGAGYARFLLTPDGRPYLLRLRPGLCLGAPTVGPDPLRDAFAQALGLSAMGGAPEEGVELGLILRASAEGLFEGVEGVDPDAVEALQIEGEPLHAGDPVLALRARADRREEAIDALAEALDAVETPGLPLDKRPLTALLSAPAFRAGPLCREAIAARLG